MTPGECVLLYGNSVFLAGIKAQLDDYPALDLVMVDAGCEDVMRQVRERQPRALLFDVTISQLDLAVPLLREQAGLLLIGVDASSDKMVVVSSRPAEALSADDLVNVICQNDPRQEAAKGE